MSSIVFGATMVPKNIVFRASDGESNGKEWKMKWKLGFYTGYLSSILFGATMVPSLE